MTILTLDIKPISSNVFSHLHWAKKKQFKNEMEELVFYECKINKIKPIKVYPILFYYEFYFKTKHRHDLDNYAINIKLINDGLRYAKVLEDDTIDYVPHMDLKGFRDDKDYIIIKW